MEEKRIRRAYVIDKDIWKKMAHRAIDEECDNADLMESILDGVMGREVALDKIRLRDKDKKTFRFYQKYWDYLDELSEKYQMTQGEVLMAILSKYL